MIKFYNFIATTAFSKYKIESLFEIGIPINILQLLRQCPCYDLDKVRSFLQNSWAILSSFKTVFIFNDTSAEIKKKSADVLLKMITILKEHMRIAQVCAKNERTLVHDTFSIYRSVRTRKCSPTIQFIMYLSQTRPNSP